jgi:stage II sporulation protein D
MRALGVIVLCLIAVTAATAGSATPSVATPQSSVLVVAGRGWGHGVGMSQWGARGYAQHGWSYRQILAHYYPGTRLVLGGEPRVRVLLEQGVSVATFGCPTRMTVNDGSGAYRALAAGTYGVSPRLVFQVGHVRVRVHDRKGAHVVVRTVSRKLQTPVIVDCPTAPLVFDGRPYHGLLVFRSAGRRLSVINSLTLDTYVRDVVGAEMPSHWGLAALEAQAVAARSYAVATLHPSAEFDEYPDDRSQVYGGIAAESPSTDYAVAQTAGQVLTWDGRVATTYYSSSSGGETADVRDVFPAAAPVPYLRSVADPYDIASPNHEWGPIVYSASSLGADLGVGGAVSSVRIEHGPSGRAVEVDVEVASGHVVRLSAKAVERALHLRSTWFTIGELGLSASGTRLLYGSRVTLNARISDVSGVTLEQRLGSGPWRSVRVVRGGMQLTLVPRGTTSYRLSAPGVAGRALAVSVAPRIWAKPLAPQLLEGKIQPRSDGKVTVWRYGHAGWRLVAHPRLDAHGVFRSPLRLRPGTYRVQVAADGRFAANQSMLNVNRRLLAALGRG